MKIINIYGDIQRGSYEDLVRLLGSYAATCQLVSHGEPITQSCKKTLSELVRLGETTKEVSEWYGTRLQRGNAAILHTLPINQEIVSFVASHVDSLFSWRWPCQPEDLCFLAADGVPILISTAHERYARLMLDDDIYLSDALSRDLESASTKKQPSGFVVNLPASSLVNGQGMVYVGIEGDGWPIELPDMPTMNDGLASENELDRCVAYWRDLMIHEGCGFARLLYLGERPPRERFRPIGFDCGFYSNETDNFSLVLNELHLRTLPGFAEYKRRLNEYGLFETYENAAMFLNDVLVEPVLRKTYKGCTEDLLVVKVHSYLR